MDYDLIAIFWTFVFVSLFVFSLRKLTKKTPTQKRWVRPEINDDTTKSDKDSQ